jgi:FdrA protein
MSGAPVLNRVRRAFYLDSVALMRLSQSISALPGVETAALMIGTPSNKRIMADAGLLADEGRDATPNDLIVALRAIDRETGEAALRQTEALLDRPAARAGTATVWRPKTMNAATRALPGANLALISVPGTFAEAEARKALRSGLHVMIFSDNVTIEDECDLKREARERGLLLMGPDCGTALIGGVPLAFANEVPQGDIGIVAASGTGLQEVSCLIARAGKGVSHGIGVGGRDLGETVGGAMTLAAIDALDADPATDRIVLISKPPAPAVARKVLKRIGDSAKSFTIFFAGLEDVALPANAHLAATLKAAAEDSLGGAVIELPREVGYAAAQAGAALGKKRRWIRGLYSGGTLCAEAQIVLRATDDEVRSNVPVPGAVRLGVGEAPAHSVVDLGADEYTVGRPHPMIDPAIRSEHLARALAEPGVAVVLLDVVIGHGAHDDPAGAVVAALAEKASDGPAVVASVCGTEGDPQVYSAQVRALESAGVIVAPSNAQAAEIALQIGRRAL